MSEQEIYAARDLWWEARERTRRESEKRPGLGDKIRDALFKSVATSLPGRPVVYQMVPTALASRDDVVWFPDFNKYRIRRLKPYIDAGCQALMLRIGGPRQWVQHDYRYEIDATYRSYLEEADRLGMLDRVIGYIVHNPFEGWTVNGATGETVHTELIDEWTSGGYMPKAFCYDHEVSTCWSSVGQKIIATAHNQVTSLAENTLNTYRKFKRTVAVYSAKWFMNLTPEYWTWHDTYFSNINKPEAQGGAGVQRPLMLAWYIQQAQLFSNMAEVSQSLPVPTPEQVGKLLWVGYQAQSWQFTSTLQLRGAMPDGSDDTVGVDMNVSLEPSATFYYNFGLTPDGQTDPPPPPPPPVDPDLSAIMAALADIKLELQEQEAELAAIRAQLAEGISMTWTGGTQ